MIYGYEQPVQYNPVEVFNPVTANMVLQSMGQYADVLQREHERALQEEKEFLKDYGDFSSPVNGAAKAYYNLGIGNVKKALDIAYANGVDLTRSQEGRAMLSRIINSANVRKMNELKQQKEAAELYNKTMQTLVANGKLTPEQAARKMQWDGVNDFQALDENENVRQYPTATISPFEGTDQYIDRVFGKVAETYLGTDGAFDVNGVGTQQLAQTLAQSLPSYLNTDGGRYAFEQFVERNYGIDLPDKAAYNNAIENKELYNAFANDLLQGASGKYARKQLELNPLAKINAELEKQKELKTFEVNENIRQYKQTHPDEFDSDGNPKTSTAPSVAEQSYVRDIWNTSIGKIFGTDGYTASHMIEGEEGYTNAGQNIFKQEERILRDYKCDVDKCISAHTTVGNLQSNIKILDIPMGGSFKKDNKSSSNTTLTQNQFLKQNTKKKIYDGSDIIFNTAGYYKKKKERTDEQKKDKENLDKATYFTVTNEIVGHLHKGGRYVLYIKVIADNGAVGYIPATLYSHKKESGHAYSSKNKNHDQDLGLDTELNGSIKQRDLQATNVYTKEGSATNEGALEREAQN